MGNQTHLNEGQVGNHLSAHLDVEGSQLPPRELDGEPLQGDGEGSLGLRGEGGGAGNPGVRIGQVVGPGQVVGHLLVGCNLPWVELQLLLGEGEQVQSEMSDGECNLLPRQVKAEQDVKPSSWHRSSWHRS